MNEKRKYKIKGTVTDKRDGCGVPNLRVEAWDKDLAIDDLLGTTKTDKNGRFTISFDETYYQEICVDRKPDIYFKVYSGEELVCSTEDSVLWNVSHSNIEIALSVNLPSPKDKDKHRVEGHIFFEYRLPAVGITVRLYSRGFGGVEKLLGKGKTDDQGFYEVSYDPGGKSVNLEVRIVDARGKEITLSDTKFKVDKHEVLNLVAPASVWPLAAEYHQLVADLEKQLGGMEKLAGAQEKAERQDLSILHQVTGWDARLIALLATAAKLSADTGIRQDVLYALFRIGLPTKKQILASVSSSAVEKALNKAKEKGIVSLNNRQITMAKAAFEKFARKTRRAAKAPGTPSSFDDLIKHSGLIEEGGEQDKFYDVYFSHQGTAAELWRKFGDKLKGIGYDDDTIAKKVNGLRLQGKLAYLTLNNAEVTATLQKKIGSLGNLAQLVGKGKKDEKDYYKEDAWKKLLKENMAKNNEQVLQKLIPPAYVGEKAEDRLNAYAADLARKVRLSFPTRVVGRMIENDELHLGDGHDKAAVITFLKKAEVLGFELGRVPVDAFVKKNEKKLFLNNTPEEKIKATKQSVKKLQRLYQITPTNEALKVLLDLGFTSAHDVVAFSRDDFLDRFGDSFPSLEEAELVYRKSQQVSTVTYTFFTTAELMDSAPAVHVISSPAEVRKNVKNELIKHYPTMESLFGSLDFCECEHCRSVLSPAAYLVDLLQFLDPDDQVWKGTLDDWKNKHNGERYMKDWNYDPTGETYKDERKKPYYALIERRPDLPHLPLTCENTHTALPYIDVVNEILEYYVVYNNLNNYQGYDTGEAITPELLAEPQNILPKAYDELKKEQYPLALPFDLWLETARRFFDHFETPLWQVLQVFRPSDDLFAPQTNRKAYYRADIFTEYLGMSPDEYDVFTNSSLHSSWYKLYGYATEATALTKPVDAQGQRIDLNSAKALSRRLGVSYKELTEIVQTSFVNPELDKLALVWKLRFNITDVVQYFNDRAKPEYATEKQAIEHRLNDFDTEHKLAANSSLSKLEERWTDGTFKKTLVLRDSSGLCNFNQTHLEFAVSGSSAAEEAEQEANLKLVLLKINLFVRLWKKLGWTIKETDRALQVFLPNSPPLTIQNLEIALETALVYIAHLKALDERVRGGKNSRLKLLTLWSNLPTTGKNPLYAQLFLTRSVLNDDSNKQVFDHPLGRYLCYFDYSSDGYKPFWWDANQPEDSKTGNVSLKSHLLALQGALNLTADDIGQILEDARKSLDTEPLTLATVSLFYRYGLLAKAMKLTVRDLITLKELSGLDPFRFLELVPITSLSQDYPFEQTLRFVEVVEKVKESGFTVEDLNFLLCHRFDPVGKYRSKSDAILLLMKTLATEIQRIQAEHALPDSTNAITDDFLRQKLSLVLPADVLDRFFGFWEDTIEFSAKKEQVEGDAKLDPMIYQVNNIRISYNATRKWQYVVHGGVLTNDKKTNIFSKIPQPDASASQGQKDAYNNFIELLNKIATESQPQPKAFFDRHFEGFLTYDDLYGPAAAGLSEEAMRRKILAAILPFVQQRLIRQFVVQTLATDLNADPVLTEVLLTARRVPLTPTQLGEPLIADPNQSSKLLLDAFAASGECGVSTTFLDSGCTQLGQTITTEAADTAIKVDNTPVKPTEAESARFEGYIEVPATGAYRFFAVFTTKDATAELSFAHLPNPVIRYKATKNNDETDQFVELKAGIPYCFTFEIGDPMGGDVSLLVQGENLPKDSLSRLTLYPQAVVERVLRNHALLAKMIQLIQGLELSEREVRHILTHRADFNNIDLGKLPTLESDSTAASPVTLFKQFLLLADYAHLKRTLSAGTDDLIGVFENSYRTYPEITNVEEVKNAHFKPVANLTGRTEATVRAVAESLGFAINATPDGNGYRVDVQDIVNVEKLWRLWEALQMVEKLGVPVEKIVSWATPALDFSIAQDLRNTVNARYEPENWQRIAQSIFDKLRQCKRDALVAYIMHKEGFERIEQLFEYFLIDPGMEPVVQTSRLRLAISSVQLFIQRSLLSLEKKVHPSAINSRHWQWMKRYRVWEANRKIFLFPENWLEPEFRDDKTHLFQEFEGALLQGDVSNDLVEDAFFNYLKKLEELARLDIVTMYCEEKSDPASNTLHVIGRTYSLPHKYFYRRYAYQMWTPWEPVTAEMEGDHVVAVVWRERLHLFWVTFLEKTKQDTTSNKTFEQMAGKQISTAMQKEVEVQLNWSEYFQGEWTTRESSGFADPIRVDVSNNFESSNVFIFVSQNIDGSLLVNLDTFINKAFRVVSKNSLPEPVNCVFPQKSLPYSIKRDQPTRYTGSGALSVTLVERLETEYDKPTEIEIVNNKDIIQGIGEDGKFSLLLCSRASTLIGEIREIFYVIKEGLPAIYDPFSITDLLERLVFFAEYLPLRLSNPSTQVTAAILNEWQAIRDDIEQLLRSSIIGFAWYLKYEAVFNGIDYRLQCLTDPAAAATVAEELRAEIRKFIDPFFYQDEQHTFFVEPTLTETTITDWKEWIPRDIATIWFDYIEGLPVEVNIPGTKPSPPDQIDPLAHFNFKWNEDWFTDPATVFRFDDSFIGKEGGLDLKVLHDATNMSDFDTLVNVNPGSELASGNMVVAYGGHRLDASRFSLPGSGLNVIGGGGLNPVLLRSLSSKSGGV